MHNFYPIEELKLHPNYLSASEILNSILRSEIPDKKDLNKVFGNLATHITYNLEKHFEAFPVKTENIRKHTAGPSVIAEARARLAMNEEYAALHSKILTNEIPGIDDIYPIYGEYSDTVQTITALYKTYRLKRKCEIPAAAHPSRVGGLVHTLGFDIPGSHKFCTIAFLHDCIEDLIRFEKRAHFDHYGLKGLGMFINDYIPEELQPNVRILTNHYSLILNYLNYLLTISDTQVNRKNLLKNLENLSSMDWSLNEKVIKLHTLLDENDLTEPVLVNAKWLCYKDLYISEMADDALAMSDFRTFEIKAIDLTDNAHGSGALSMTDRLRNIIKLGIWASQGYRLHTSWSPTNNFIEELFEYALNYSEHIVIKDFLQPGLKQDLFASALFKIEELKSVFYTDRSYEKLFSKENNQPAEESMHTS